MKRKYSDGKYIPNDVLYDTELSPGSRLLYIEILFLAHNTGLCFASNQYFQKKFGVSEKTIIRWLKELRENECIESRVYKKMGSVEVERRDILCLKCVRNTKKSTTHCQDGQICPSEDKNDRDRNNLLEIDYKGNPDCDGSAPTWGGAETNTDIDYESINPFGDFGDYET